MEPEGSIASARCQGGSSAGEGGREEEQQEEEVVVEEAEAAEEAPLRSHSIVLECLSGSIPTQLPLLYLPSYRSYTCLATALQCTNSSKQYISLTYLATGCLRLSSFFIVGGFRVRDSLRSTTFTIAYEFQ